jgi:hypothetical protein
MMKRTLLSIIISPLICSVLVFGLIGVVVLSNSCKSKTTVQQAQFTAEDSARIVDSCMDAVIKKNMQYDSLYAIFDDTKGSSNKAKRDTVFIPVTISTGPISKKEFDAVKDSLFRANLKIEKAKVYVKICLRNPTQDKFLKGWMRRLLDL